MVLAGTKLQIALSGQWILSLANSDFLRVDETFFRLCSWMDLKIQFDSISTSSGLQIIIEWSLIVVICQVVKVLPWL